MKEIKLSNTSFSVSVGTVANFDDERKGSFLANLGVFTEAELLEKLQTEILLEIEDLDGKIDSEMYNRLCNLYNIERSNNFWQQIEKMPDGSPQQKTELRGVITDFISKGFVVNETERKALLKKIEQSEWDAMGDNPSIAQLQDYLKSHPESAFKDDIDDALWSNDGYAVEDYLKEWPTGKHIAEANAFVEFRKKWQDAKRSRDISMVAECYREMNTPGSNIPKLSEVESFFNELKSVKLQELLTQKNDLSDADLDYAKKIFSESELKTAGLVKREMTPPTGLPSLEECMVENSNLTAPDNCTDVYFFGIPNTGKTCLMMGLVGANAKTDCKGQVLYEIEQSGRDGGNYAYVLGSYLGAKMVPSLTTTNFTCVINGTIFPDTDIKGDSEHHINLVEMAGENFRTNIVNNIKTESFEELGHGLTNLLKNNNRKLFFLIVDCTADGLQAQVLSRLVDLFKRKENREFMEKVDAIHFIVTKADIWGDDENVRRKEAVRLLNEKYYAPVNILRRYCIDTQRINALIKNYEPQVYTFSLGKFYVGGKTFDYDPKDAMKIMEVIRGFTQPQLEEGFLSKIFNQSYKWKTK